MTEEYNFFSQFAGVTPEDLRQYKKGGKTQGALPTPSLERCGGKAKKAKRACGGVRLAEGDKVKQPVKRTSLKRSDDGEVVKQRARFNDGTYSTYETDGNVSVARGRRGERYSGMEGSYGAQKADSIRRNDMGSNPYPNRRRPVAQKKQR